jgi:predicted RNA binding protein YcfA (HicA-like mRNA interferase family)
VRADKLKAKLLNGNVTNWSFADACLLARHCGWQLSRTGVSHHIFTHTRLGVLSLNLQEKKGQAKPYQLRQMQETIEAHNL